MRNNKTPNLKQNTIKSQDKSQYQNDILQKNHAQLTPQQKNEIKEAFASFESDGLTSEEIKSAMKTLGFDANNDEVMKILDKIDTKKGPLKFDDFMDVMIDKENEKEPEDEIKKAFKVLTEEGTDKITLKSLSKICTDLGENIDEDELMEMINHANKGQDEEVNEEDFVKIMKKIGMF